MENQNTAHTPLPWKAVNHGRKYYISICAEGHQNLATVMEKDRSEESFAVRAANAAFIVRACNSYYDLLDACKAALEEGDELIAIRKIKAAIAKAGA